MRVECWIYGSGILSASLLNETIQVKDHSSVKTDDQRDDLLTEFGKATLTDRYLMPGENFQDMFARVASYYGDN